MKQSWPHPGRSLQRLSSPGRFGMLLAIYAAGLTTFTLLPGCQREADLQQRLARHQATLSAERQGPTPDGEGTPEHQLALFHQAFPPQDALPDSLERIYALAGEQALALEQAQYKFVPEPSGRLARYEITVPASGRYPQLRRFLERVLAELPTLALRDLHFKRDGIDKDKVDAALQFVFYVRLE